MSLGPWTQHVLAYQASLSTTNLTTLTPIPDGVIPAVTGGFQLQLPARMLAAYGGAVAIDRARITAPSLLQVAYPDIRPVAAAAGPPDDPNVMFLGANSLMLEPGEPVGVDWGCGSAVEQRS